MSRFALAATTTAIALALLGPGAQARPMPAGTPLTPAQRHLARSQIIKDAKAFMQAGGIKLTRPTYRVTFGRGGWCGTPPITVSAKASINTVQTNWPDFQKVRRPAYNASFDATAHGNNVQTQRVGDWDGVMYLLGRQ